MNYLPTIFEQIAKKDEVSSEGETLLNQRKNLIFPKIFHMCQTREELILSYGEFFHLTEPRLLDAILREGLIPQQTNTLDPESRQLICVAPAGIIDRWRDQLPNATVLIRIAAENIVSKEFGIDETSQGWETFAALEEIEGLRTMIETNASLAVFDPIPPNELTIM